MSNDFKRLYRSPADGKIAGLCAGLGKYFRIDPVFFRLAWVAITIMTGLVPGTLAYLIAWFLVPQEPLHRTAEQAETPNQTRA